MCVCWGQIVINILALAVTDISIQTKTKTEIEYPNIYHTLGIYLFIKSIKRNNITNVYMYI